MAWLRRLLFLMLLPITAYGQGMRFDNFVLKPLNTGGLTAVSGALITVCTSAGSGTPCTPKVANIYSDEALTTPIVGTGGAGTTNSDSGGNFGFYAAPGSYIVTVTGAGITSYTIKVVLPLGALTNNAVGKWNSIITVDGTQFTTCDAAVTAAVTQAGSGTALVIVPSTYAGADCTTIPTNVKVQVWYFNGNAAPGVQSGVYWNNTSATPIHAWVRFQDNDPSPVGNSLSAYFIHRISGTIPAASAMDAISPEVQVVGTLNSWGASAVAQAIEAVVTVASTGGTIAQASPIVAYLQLNNGSNTNVSNIFGLYAPAHKNNGTGVITNAYGVVADVQTVGTSNNLSGWFKGATEFDASNSFICTTSNCANIIVSGTPTANGSGIVQITNTGGSGHTYKIGESFGTGRLSFRDTTQTGAPSWSLQQLSTTGGAEGIITHTNTGVRTYTFPDASGTVPLIATGDTVYGTYRVTADFTLAGNTSLQAITGLSWTMPANTALNVGFSCHLLYSQATAAVADQFGIQDVTVAPTSLMAKAQAYISTSTFTAANVPALTTTTATPIVTFTPSAITTIWNADIDGMIEQPSNASTSVVQIMAQQSNAADLLTVKRGSFCRVW